MTVDSAVWRDLQVQLIDEPAKVRRLITGQIDDTDTEFPGTTDQWQAVLSVDRMINEAIR